MEQSYYAVIPANVRYDRRLKPIERLLYGEITALTNKEGFCFAKNNYFSQLYECTTRAVRMYLNHLQECGYITILVENKNSRKIFLITADEEEERALQGEERAFQGEEKTFRGVGKNFPGGRKELSYPIIRNIIIQLIIQVITPLYPPTKKTMTGKKHGKHLSKCGKS